MDKPLRVEEIRAYERRLRALLDELAEQVIKVEENTLQPSGDPEGQPEDENIEDTAFERDLEVLATEDRLAYQVRDALARVRDGSYGTCEACARPIERARLDQVPYASACAACARKSEAERR